MTKIEYSKNPAGGYSLLIDGVYIGKIYTDIEPRTNEWLHRTVFSNNEGQGIFVLWDATEISKDIK